LGEDKFRVEGSKLKVKAQATEISKLLAGFIAYLQKHPDR
jgi:hypothetical protein